MNTHDAVIIGTGQAGKPLATALAKAGWKTAIIERDRVGGSCIIEGCTPTKTMVASARVAYLARRAADYGVVTGDVSVDLEKVRKRKRDIVDSWSDGGRRGLESKSGLELIMGEARLVSATSVEVALENGGTRTLTAPKIFINTGTRSLRPRIEGLDRVATLDNRSVMELGEVPKHLIVLGGGYIGLEFGQMFRRFGADVTMIHSGAQLLSREDADIAEAVAEILRGDEIEVMLGARTAEVTKMSEGIELRLELGGSTRNVTGSHLLVATGRTPNTDRLGLDAAGITTDNRGFIPVNERLETEVQGIYALGDVNGGPAFTHVAYDDFRVVRSNLLEGGDVTTTGRLVPYTLFIDPQLGRVGLSETQARAEGRNIRVATLPMSRVARAIETDESRGFMKAIVDADTDRILGAAVLCIEGGEIMSVLQVAMMGDLPYTALKEGVFAHPTLAESLNNLFTAMDDA